MLHQGSKPETDDIENDIVKLILINRLLRVSKSSCEVIIKACSLNQYLKQKNLGV